MSPWLRQDIIELEKVQCRAARFVHNNYWPSASVTQMISTLNWESLEARCQKARLSLLVKAINDFIEIPMDHYKLSTIATTRSFHGLNLLLPSCRTAKCEALCVSNKRSSLLFTYYCGDQPIQWKQGV